MVISEDHPQRTREYYRTKLRKAPERFIDILVNSGYRFWLDDCFSRAASLAYTTLFALVPVTVLSITMFNVFRMDKATVGTTLRSVITQALPPIADSQLKALQDQLFDFLQQFVESISALNTLSIAVFAVTSVALLNTIESAMNAIWRVSSNRGVLAKLTSFWAVITLTPLLIAVSIYYSTLTRYFYEFDPQLQGAATAVFNIVFPILVTAAGLALLFFKMPASTVRFRDAALGGFVGAVLFECVKSGFAYYIARSAGYSTIYGVLATIPLFLFWLYVTWVVVLFAAEVAYQSGSIKILSGLRRYSTDLGEIGVILGLRLLRHIGANFIAGRQPPSLGDLAISSGSNPVLVRSCLDALTEAQILGITDPHVQARTLLVAPDKLTIGELAATFLSKKHRNTDDETNSGPQTVHFLELLRSKKLAGSDKPVHELTLRDFIDAGPIPGEFAISGEPVGEQG